MRFSPGSSRMAASTICSLSLGLRAASRKIHRDPRSSQTPKAPPSQSSRILKPSRRAASVACSSSSTVCIPASPSSPKALPVHFEGADCTGLPFSSEPQFVDKPLTHRHDTSYVSPVPSPPRLLGRPIRRGVSSVSAIGPAREQLNNAADMAQGEAEPQHDAQQMAMLKQQLADAQKMAALGELVGTTTHEFNNILMTVINYAKMGMRHHDAATRDKAFEKILSAR